jgi:pimeloyl-ACP methyl ester carboxylesterase
VPVNTKTRQRQQQQRWNGRGGTASKMSLRQIVYELHMLLERAGERSPDVLVGHSYGGWLVRLYEMTYPSEIIGLVLVEPGVDDPWRMMADGKLVRSSDLVTGWPIPAVKIALPLLISDIPLPGLAADAGRTGGGEPPGE